MEKHKFLKHYGVIAFFVLLLLFFAFFLFLCFLLFFASSFFGYFASVDPFAIPPKKGPLPR